MRGCQNVEIEVLGPCLITSEAVDRATPHAIGATEEDVGCVVVVRFILTIRNLSFGRIFEGKQLTRRTLLKAAGSAPS